jgi:FkbM family methyltransferase
MGVQQSVGSTRDLRKPPALPSKMPLLGKLLQTLTRKRIRGETRLRTLIVDQLKLLRYVPIYIADWPPVYMDLRDPNSLDWFVSSPMPSSHWELDEQNIMRRLVKAGDVVFDIGANIGLHTALLSRLVGVDGLVVAFEPSPAVLPALRRTVAAMRNALLFPVALSNEARESVLYLAEQLSAVASLANWTNGQYGRTHQVSCEERRLDDLIAAHDIPRPNFIKCDVEGAELKVFQGGTSNLNRADGPLILFEANVHTARGFGFGIADAMRFLAGLSRAQYGFFQVRNGGDLSRIGMFNCVNSNLLAVPHSRMADFPS